MDKIDRFALKIACLNSLAYIWPVILATYVDSNYHHIIYGLRYYWMGYWVELGFIFPFLFTYFFNRHDNRSIFSKLACTASGRSLLTFLSLFIPVLFVLWINFKPEFPQLNIFSTTFLYGLIIASIVYIHNYKLDFDYICSGTMSEYAKIERMKMELATWTKNSGFLLVATIVFFLYLYNAFLILPKQYTVNPNEQLLLFESFVLELFLGGFLAIFAFVEIGKKIQFIKDLPNYINKRTPRGTTASIGSVAIGGNIHYSDIVTQKDEGYPLITRRGHIVSLEKGKDGIDKKFQEISENYRDQ